MIRRRAGMGCDVVEHGGGGGIISSLHQKVFVHNLKNVTSGGPDMCWHVYLSNGSIRLLIIHQQEDKGSGEL